MSTCNICGAEFPNHWPQPIRCNHKRTKYESRPAMQPKPAKPNAWQVIHQRYADAIKSGQWNPCAEKTWYRETWWSLIPANGCSCKEHWTAITNASPIDFSTAESAFQSLWNLHNTVSTEHVKPPLPAMSCEQCRELWLGPKIAFIATAYNQIGGTETFHRTLLPRLRHVRNIIGFCATGTYSGNGDLLKVPYSTGIEAAAKLCSEADIVVAWGVNGLAEIMPPKRPKIIAVHHSDLASTWSTNAILKQLDYTDEIACVSESVADKLRKVTGKKIHWIPNAVDPARIQTTPQLEAIRASVAGRKVVLFGHRMDHDKRPQLAMEMAALLPSDWLLVMAGSGAYKPTSAYNVRVVGHVDTLADWLAVANVFISPSNFEGFGLSMAEANAAGVPIVATDVGIAADVATTLMPMDATAKQWADAVANIDTARPVADFGVDAHVQRWADILRL